MPIPRFLINDIAEHVRDKSRDDLVFTGVRSGTALRAAVFRRAGFDTAASAIGIHGLHPHELRHTAASLAIASGANVKSSGRCSGTSPRPSPSNSTATYSATT